MIFNLIVSIMHFYVMRIKPLFHTFTCGYCKYPLSWKATIKRDFLHNSISFYECKKCPYSLVSHYNGELVVQYYSTKTYFVRIINNSTVELFSRIRNKLLKNITEYSSQLNFSSDNVLEKQLETILLLSNE